MSMLISLCRIKIEIDQKPSPTTMNNKTNGDDDDENQEGAAVAGAQQKTRQQRENRGQRKSRKIKIENYSNVKLLANDGDDDDAEQQQQQQQDHEASGGIHKKDKGILPPNSREQTPLTGDDINQQQQQQQQEQPSSPSSPPPAGYSLEDKHFYSGNPFVEITNGIIHLYKKNELTDIKNELSKTLCLLSVPATINCHDLLHFIAPCHPVLQHIRIIRDGTPNQFMVLLEFRSGESAMEFYQTYNGAPYNSMEPESLCHALWVSAVEWGHDGLPPLGHTELPTCPVCLERMDESVDGVLTILCNHTFHANCLLKWGDATCPVCRCVQTPELTESSVCMECNGKDALWICLICGHVGCGRYQGEHAAVHYRKTNHTYALQLGTNRVWDYAGDNFVHRLLQSKTDGKLVATDTPAHQQFTGTAEDVEKVDSMQLEFTYLLTSQLDTQRKYYEEKLTFLEKLIEHEKLTFDNRLDGITKKCLTIDTKLHGIGKEKAHLDRKLNTLQVKYVAVTKELADERQMIKALQSNQIEWQTKYTKLENCHNALGQRKDEEIAELNEQIRDLMFYMEAQNTIANSELKDEIVTASVIVPTTVEPQSSASSSAAAAAASSSSSSSHPLNSTSSGSVNSSTSTSANNNNNNNQKSRRKRK